MSNFVQWVSTTLVGAVFLSANFVFASTDWQPLEGAAITLALSGKTVKYTDDSGATQQFSADGATIYAEGRPSFGSWRVTDTQYCSQWPPATGWVCYDVFISGNGDQIRFVGDSGRTWDGVYTE